MYAYSFCINLFAACQIYVVTHLASLLRYTLNVSMSQTNSSKVSLHNILTSSPVKVSVSLNSPHWNFNVTLGISGATCSPFSIVTVIAGVSTCIIARSTTVYAIQLVVQWTDGLPEHRSLLLITRRANKPRLSRWQAKWHLSSNEGAVIYAVIVIRECRGWN